MLFLITVVVIVFSADVHCQTIVWDDYRDLCSYSTANINRERNRCENATSIIVERRTYRDEEPFWCISIDNRDKLYNTVNITFSGPRSTRRVDYGIIALSGIELITEDEAYEYFNISRAHVASFTIYPSSSYYDIQNIVSIRLNDVEMCSEPVTYRSEIIHPNQPSTSVMKYFKKCRWIDNRIHRPPNRCEHLNQVVFEELSFNGEQLFYCIIIDRTKALAPTTGNDTLTVEFSNSNYISIWSRNATRSSPKDRKSATFYINTEIFYLAISPKHKNVSTITNVLSIKYNNRESCRLRIDPTNEYISCGVRKIRHQGFITFGHETYHGKYPWHAALYQLTSSLEHNYICGGSLISSNAVLTAAHCVENTIGTKTADILRVQLGKWDLTIANPDTKEFRVIEVITHPDFDVDYLENDIAILKLENYVTYTKYIQPICLNGHEDSDFYINRIGFVPGWGTNEAQLQNLVLHEAGMPIVTHQECRRSKRNFFSNFLNENNFCAGFRNGTSVCDGDSGGGLAFQLETGWHLKGIVSLGSATKAKRCDIVEYVLFTDVTKYFNWIYNHLFMLV